MKKHKQKIVFFCGALEPGRDGVGDYSRMLCTETVKLGYDCMLIALNDPYVEQVSSVKHFASDRTYQVLRVPGKMNWKERIVLLKKAIDVFNPDWLSLQYVSFAFEVRGLPVRFASRLKMIGGSRKWHIMFHELWVGMASGSSRKEMLWGTAQRFLNNYLMKVLRPSVINTHTTLYQAQLARSGFKSSILSLPSNLPVYAPEKIKEKLNGLQYFKTVDLVLFGAVHHGAPVQQFAREAADYGKTHGVVLNLVVIGKSSPAQEEWINAWKISGLSVEVLGQLEEQVVSEVLTRIHFGVFTTPLALVQKSSAVATMRAHGVNLMAVSRKWIPRDISLNTNTVFMEYEAGNLAEFLASKPDFSDLPSPEEVAQQFMSHLLTQV